MIMSNINDTIAAIATPIGESGIGIVRISGRDALSVADKIFVSKDGRKSPNFKTYTTHYGWIVSGRRPQAASYKQTAKNLQPVACSMQQDIVDEVILTVMRAPKSYTKEDIVEINCHGGIVALRNVLDLVLENGCRLARPGEFTQRAFLNGRIDLTQAEAVLDVIRAKTDSALRVGMEQLKGVLSNEINKIREALLDILSVLEAKIDFPEEEIDVNHLKDISGKIENINIKLNKLLDSARKGRIFREGIHAVICGRPNVGKSSLLNALLKQERSIVTPVPGTTRDTIEEIIDIKGIPIRIVDTAGIVEPGDLVEKKAVLRSKKYIKLADLIILIFDGSRKLTKEDTFLIQNLKRKQVIAVINKMDLKQKIERDKILKKFSRAINISAKRLKNINLLEDEITDLVFQGKIDNSESVMVSNLRHTDALSKAQKLVAEATNSLDNKLSLEFIAQDIKDALGSLDYILGRGFSEDLLDKIFSEFCIGK
jgi:tRNA modification GTPase